MAEYSFAASFATAFAALGGTQNDKTLLELLKEFLGIDPGDGSQDEALTQALNFAGDQAEKYLDRVVLKRETTQHFPHYFGSVILHDLPVEDPVRVYLNGVEEIGQFSWFRDRGGMAHLSRTGQRQDVPMDWRNYDSVDVTYVAGFDPIPSDLAQSIVYIAAGLYKSTGTGNIPSKASGDVRSMTVFDVGSVSYDTGSSSGGATWAENDSGIIPDRVASMMSGYKRMVS